jgi:hypothetical protein
MVADASQSALRRLCSPDRTGVPERRDAKRQVQDARRATPRGARHGAFVRGEHTIEAIGERLEAAALNETTTELLFEAFRAQTDVALKLRRELLRSEEAETRREAIKTQVAAALGMRERGIELRDAWTRRWLTAEPCGRRPHARAGLGKPVQSAPPLEIAGQTSVDAICDILIELDLLDFASGN